VWFALGGTGAVVAALARLFGELGGTLRLNAEVARITLERGRATGVQVRDGAVIPADAVVSNGDVAHTYHQLLPAAARRTYTDTRLRRLRYSMSLVVIYFGTDRTYRDQGLAHHNIIPRGSAHARWDGAGGRGRGVRGRAPCGQAAGELGMRREAVEGGVC
jgi:phytoene desaturase